MKRGLRVLDAGARRGPAAAGRGLAVTVALAVLGGCQRSDPPELLSVHRLEPARAAAGDRLTITGEGFPEGRTATVTFRGDLYRPGTPPERDVRITVQAPQAGRNVLAMPLDGALERRFLGRGEGKLHTTFQGELRVAFEPGTSGLTSIYGTAHGVRFDVLPTPPEPRDPGSDAPPATLAPAAFLGLAASGDPAGAGLRVTAVAPEGRAAAAGLRAGDLLVDFDGVTALSDADLRALGGEQVAQALVEREGRILPPLAVDVDGMAPLGPTDLTAPAGVLAGISAILALLATRLAAVLRWAPHAANAAPGRSSPESRGRRSVARAIDAVVGPVAAAGGAGVAAWLTFGLVIVGLVRLATGHSLLSADLDLIASALSVSVAVLCTRLADGGMRPDGSWSFREALRTFSEALACVVPALLAVGGAILASGRFVIAEMVAGQGAAPWRWAAAQNPGLAVLTLVLFASTWPEAGDRGALAAAGLPPRSGQGQSVLRGLLRLAEWSYLWVMSSLGAVLLLGGWRLPGVPSLVQESSRALSMAGAALVVMKVVVIVLLTGAARHGLSRVYTEHVAPLSVKWALPGAALAVALAAGWSTALESAGSAPLAELCGLVATLVATLGAGYLAFVATRTTLPGAASNTGVNPWL